MADELSKNVDGFHFHERDEDGRTHTKTNAEKRMELALRNQKEGLGLTRDQILEAYTEPH